MRKAIYSYPYSTKIVNVKMVAADYPINPPEEVRPTNPINVATINNHVYFYSDVTPESCLALIRELRNAAAELRASDYGQTPIILHVMSNGGDAFPALAVADQMGQIGWRVESVIEGVCASAGTFIALAAATCRIQRNAFMLIHSLSAGFDGTIQQIQDHTTMLDQLNEQMAEFYVAHTAAKKQEIMELMLRDSWLSATEAVEAGIVDGVM